MDISSSRPSYAWILRQRTPKDASPTPSSLQPPSDAAPSYAATVNEQQGEQEGEQEQEQEGEQEGEQVQEQEGEDELGEDEEEHASSSSNPEISHSDSKNNDAPQSYRIRLVPCRNPDTFHFDPIVRDVRVGGAPLRVGRFTPRGDYLNPDKIPFRSKVVSRAHAELWVEETGNFFFKDTKSSSGTFINHMRLSPPGQESLAHLLKDGDVIQLGVDYQGGTEEIYKSVKIKVEVGQGREGQGRAPSPSFLIDLSNLVALAPFTPKTNHDAEGNMYPGKTTFLPRETGRSRSSSELASAGSSSSSPRDNAVMQSNDINQALTTGEGWHVFIPFDKSFVGKYRRWTTEPHAFGGFSDVWTCDALMSDNTMQKVAAKELRAVNMPIEKTNPEYVQGRMIKRLQREIAVWSRLEHPHIVPLIGFRMEPRTCLISPWYSNGSVKDWVKDHPEVDGRKLMWQVANGLTYLHSRDPPIIHGDIKSDNILINNEGKAVINDFGLSQILEDISMESAKTSSTGFVGNVRWLAPEIFLDGVPRSMASDVYAFGCLVLEIATRALPFRGLQDIQVARALMSLTPPAADPAIYPELHESDALWGLMSTCWLHECTERPTMTWIEAQLQG